MKKIPINDQMSQIIERADQEEYEKFKRESIARYNMKRAEKEQKETTTHQSPVMPISNPVAYASG